MSDRDFVFHSVQQRVRFAAGSSEQLQAELEQLGTQRALVLCTPEQRPLAERIAAALGDLSVGVYDQAVMHVPMETARAAQAQARKLGADCAWPWVVAPPLGWARRLRWIQACRYWRCQPPMPARR